MKFQNPSDFAKAVNIMQEIGLLITENMPPAQPAPLSIPSPAPSTNSLSGFNAGKTVYVGICSSGNVPSSLYYTYSPRQKLKLNS